MGACASAPSADGGNSAFGPEETHFDLPEEGANRATPHYDWPGRRRTGASRGNGSKQTHGEGRANSGVRSGSSDGRHSLRAGRRERRKSPGLPGEAMGGGLDSGDARRNLRLQSSRSHRLLGDFLQETARGVVHSQHQERLMVKLFGGARGSNETQPLQVQTRSTSRLRFPSGVAPAGEDNDEVGGDLRMSVSSAGYITDEKEMARWSIGSRDHEILLHQVFPPSIARRLESSGFANLSESNECVSLLFADITGFTRWSSGHSPQRVVDTLTVFFTLLDDLAEEHNVYKVETVGYVVLQRPWNAD